MPVRVRIATADDAPEVANVYLSSRKTFLSFSSLAHTDDEVRNWISSILIPTGNVYVAENDKGIVGMMAISASDTISWIDQLYLAPDAVGQGIGSQLLQTAMEKLNHPIRLYTFQQNHGARKFYERHGFREISRSDGSDNEEKCPDILFEYRHSES